MRTRPASSPSALLLCLAAALIACEDPAPEVTVEPMEPVDSFHYWLQDITVDTSAANDALPDLFILDPSTDTGPLTGDELAWFRGPDSLGIALAYLSIGEAEDSRSYWDGSWSDSPPSWLGPENPDWAGNFKVHYWNEDWRAILLDELDALCAQGFDGAYVGGVDAYLYWSEDHAAEAERLPREVAADRMLDLFAWLAEAGQSACGSGFLLVPQNGERVGRHSSNDRSMQLSSGLGVEDVYCPPDEGEWTDAPFEPDDSRITRMTTFVDNALPVLSIEYLLQPDLQANHDEAAEPAGFVTGHFCRALDRSHEFGPDPCPEG